MRFALIQFAEDMSRPRARSVIEGPRFSVEGLPPNVFYTEDEGLMDADVDALKPVVENGQIVAVVAEAGWWK